jgi:hypothetical protein
LRGRPHCGVALVTSTVIVITSFVILNSHVYRWEANARALSGVTRITSVRPIVIANRDSVLYFRLGAHAVHLAQLTTSALSNFSLSSIEFRKTESRVANITSGAGNLIKWQCHHIR